MSVSIRNLYNCLKTQRLNVFRSQAHHCRQVHDSLRQGQKTTPPRGPKRTSGKPSGGLWGVPGRTPRRAQNARGGRFHCKYVHFVHDDDFSSVTPFLKFCEKRKGRGPASKRAHADESSPDARKTRVCDESASSHDVVKRVRC